MHKLECFMENKKHKRLWDFEIQTDHLNQQKRKRTSRMVDFAVAADLRVKLNEIEKEDKYLDLAMELKKLWNIKPAAIAIVLSLKDWYKDWRT